MTKIEGRRPPLVGIKMSSPFVIHFISKIDTSETDHTLKIQTSTNDTFLWSYHEAGAKNVQQVTLTRNSVNARLENLLKLVSYDTEPPTHLQVDVPGYPQVMIANDDVDVVKTFIMDALDFAMGAWPAPVPKDSCVIRVVDLPPSEADSSDISDTESMPPLVNMEEDSYNYAYANNNYSSVPRSYWYNE